MSGSGGKIVSEFAVQGLVRAWGLQLGFLVQGLGGSPASPAENANMLTCLTKRFQGRRGLRTSHLADRFWDFEIPENWRGKLH